VAGRAKPCAFAKPIAWGDGELRSRSALGIPALTLQVPRRGAALDGVFPR
jgi:hypothetical protein